MEMDYAHNAGSAIGQMAHREPAPRPADLPSLRAQLADQVERARMLGMRAHDIADGVFGCRPEPQALGIGVGSAATAPPSLSQLVEELQSALTRIEQGLNRV